ncbi:MAG: hypothetical protein JJV95_00330 [Sulfurospirillum sp.]|nr:hypothetical protein [Sulfurospirillum sp.]
MEYNRFVSSCLVSMALTSGLLANDIPKKDIALSNKASYDSYVDYSSYKNSTSHDSTLKNDIEMIKQVEISNILNKIEEKYNTKVYNTWIPAEGYLDKLCLFISLENQDYLKLQYDDLELDLFLTVEDNIKQSQLFDMIALM